MAAAALFIAGCAELFDPNDARRTFVLTTIQDRQASEVNQFQLLGQADTIHGTYAFIDADTVILFGDGRGEQRGAYRMHIVTHPHAPGHPPFDRSASFRRAVRYFEGARAIVVVYSECLEAFCYMGDSPVRFDRVDGGALSFDPGEIGPWRYERVDVGRTP